jgi:hypothetical protein
MSKMEQIRKSNELDLAQLEADVAHAALVSTRASSVQAQPMPEYVEHQDGVPRVGVLAKISG